MPWHTPVISTFGKLRWEDVRGGEGRREMRKRSGEDDKEDRGWVQMKM